ncbi:DUF4907 domain-containing protein [Aureisphaera galaxeae]|uniref:DUF4907 domain-containing protein n=1 Tax=Aureisphaera galaxeae TaxID=1538023 RepID=UPI002350BEDD|nr:DUF4907 domain-containing protein [Aureisphaera galaxeae]MDC8004823.1 DUF4907 domain-containing protein [Aureisphaera galaxeae]
MKRRISYLAAVSIIFIVVIVLTLMVTESREATTPAYHSKIAQLSNSSHWYYEIYKNNQLIIKQSHIPGVKGIQGFQSKEEAQKVATVVVKKLVKGDFPTVSKEELEELSITFKN